jgi:hypothetical protein
MTLTKQEIIDEICSLTGLQKFWCSSGSTEPKAFFEALASQLGISESLGVGLTKQEIAKQICLSLGGNWDDSCQSEGATVTRAGLQNIRDALGFLT